LKKYDFNELYRISAIRSKRRREISLPNFFITLTSLFKVVGVAMATTGIFVHQTGGS
jgi:hypothetical protein